VIDLIEQKLHTCKTRWLFVISCRENAGVSYKRQFSGPCWWLHTTTMQRQLQWQSDSVFLLFQPVSRQTTGNVSTWD